MNRPAAAAIPASEVVVIQRREGRPGLSRLRAADRFRRPVAALADVTSATRPMTRSKWQAGESGSTSSSAVSSPQRCAGGHRGRPCPRFWNRAGRWVSRAPADRATSSSEPVMNTVGQSAMCLALIPSRRCLPVRRSSGRDSAKRFLTLPAEVLMLEESPAARTHRHDAHGFSYVLEGSIVMGVQGGRMARPFRDELLVQSAGHDKFLVAVKNAGAEPLRQSSSAARHGGADGGPSAPGSGHPLRPGTHRVERLHRRRNAFE